MSVESQETASGHRLNAEDLDRTVFISDNLPFLRSLDSESIDLVIIDPPFAKIQTFTGKLIPELTDAELEHEYELLDKWGIQNEDDAYDVGIEYPDQSGTTAQFSDIWDFRYQVEKTDWDRLEQRYPAAKMLIETTRHTHSDSIAAYITFMTLRMIEIRRILKSSGSVYLHCDHSANAYLRQMMDALFGVDRFQNEITWPRYAVHSLSASFDNVADTILAYSKSATPTINKVVGGKPTQAEIMKRFPHVEEQTGRRFQHVALEQSSNQSSAGEKRHIDGKEVISTIGWRWTQETFEQRIADNPRIIYWTKNGRPRYKIYADEYAGNPLGNIWTDIPYLSAGDSERTGYPTQKPQALARRIIEASSNPGNVVLDCFAGCAYVPVAAELTGRRWIACDVSPRAWTVVRRQFEKHSDLGIVTEGKRVINKISDRVEVKFEKEGAVISVRGPHELPERKTKDEPSKLMMVEDAKIVFRTKPLEDSKTIWKAFVEEWGTGCWYCGQIRPEDRRELHLDHIEPKDGTNNDCWNRALACVPCNNDKRHVLTVKETMNKALEAERIATDALRREVITKFEDRHKWANERWEKIKQQRADLSRQVVRNGVFSMEVVRW